MPDWASGRRQSGKNEGESQLRVSSRQQKSKKDHLTAEETITHRL